MQQGSSFYARDLAHVHDTGFRRFADGIAPGVLDLLSGGGPGGTVVDLGCGGGIWAAALVAAGYRVVGLDLSPSMIAIARGRVPEAKFEVGSAWDARLPTCRAVTALGEVLCYRADGKSSRKRLSSLFRKVRDALEPGGLFVFDLAEIGLDRDSPPTFTETDDWTCLVRFTYDGRRHRLTRHITTYRRMSGDRYRREHETHQLQLYDAAQVERELRAAGFRARRARRFGDFPLLPGRVGFVARKPG